MDYATIIQSVKKTNRIVVVDESWPFCIYFHLKLRMLCNVMHSTTWMHLSFVSTVPIRPLPYAASLVDAWMPNPEKIIKAVKICDVSISLEAEGMH